MSVTTTSNMKTAALSYAEQFRFRVFPVHSPDEGDPENCDCRRLDCSSPAKHPRTMKGVLDASNDAAAVQRWWDSWPNANVAAATGGDVGYIVLDVDPDHGGIESLLDLESKHGPLPLTPTVRTGGGGSHYWFRAPLGTSIRNSAGRLGPGLDVRAEGGYVLLPPSLHASGGRYEWLADAHIRDVSIAEIPPWLLDLLTEPKHPTAASPIEGIIAEGQRNHALASLAGSMRNRGMEEASIAAALIEENTSKCVPPLPESEVRAIANSVARYQPSADVSQMKERKNPQDPEDDSFIPSVPEFPVDALPDLPRRFVEQAAEVHGVPTEFVALPLLAYAGAAIGRTACIQLKRGFRQFPTLWTVVVAPPGTGKTPAASTARAPLAALQRRASSAHDTELAQYDEDLSRWQAEDKSSRGAPPIQPQLEHYYSTDTTMEAVAAMLSESAGFSLQQDEIVTFVRSFDQYRGGKGGDRQRWLSLWSSEDLKVDRRSADTLMVTSPVVTIAGGVQPDVLGELASEAGRSDGFLERMMFAYPSTEPARWNDQEVDEALVLEMQQLFGWLRGANLDEPRVVTLDPSAYERWRDWYDANTDESESRGVLAGVDAKLPLLVARVALILWCWQHPDPPNQQRLDRGTLDGAIRIAEYSRAHSAKALAEIEQRATDGSPRTRIRVTTALQKNDGQWQAKSSLQRATGLKAEPLLEELASLVEEGVIEHRKVGTGKSGRIPDEWRVKPPAGAEPTEVRI